MAFWCADPADHPLTPEEIARTPFALVHADGLPVFSAREFAHRRAYFRLINQGIHGNHPCPAGFALKQVNPQEEVHAIINLIRACYASIKINAEIVQSWIRHPVYDPNLWVWVVDQESGEKAGLGIAERDPLVPEASLEWIQVHPAYQNRGIGKAIVSELTRRALQGVSFITVSGEVESESLPEQLYRRCGFTGNDVWWLLFDEE
jgi:GNAT superfamily N-acetyltransferase